MLSNHCQQSVAHAPICGPCQNVDEVNQIQVVVNLHKIHGNDEHDHIYFVNFLKDKPFHHNQS